MRAQRLRRLADNVTVWRGFGTWGGRTRYALALARRGLSGDRERFIENSRAIGGIFRFGGFRFDLRPGAVDWSEVHPAYERHTRQWIRDSIRPSQGIFLDVGAHCGVYSVSLSGMFGQVVAFEPHPGSLAALIRNVQLNRLSDRVLCVSMAISSFNGLAGFMIADKETNSRLNDPAGRDTVFVGVTTLDSALKSLVIDATRIQLLKLDIEGAEQAALQGTEELLRNAQPFMIVEANSPEAQRQVREYMAHLGYQPPLVLDSVNLCYRPADASQPGVKRHGENTRGRDEV